LQLCQRITDLLRSGQIIGKVGNNPAGKGDIAPFSD